MEGIRYYVDIDKFEEMETFEPIEKPNNPEVRRNEEYFHASPNRFNVGDVLTGQLSRRKDDHDKYGVFMTNQALPHWTVVKRAYEESWHVHQLEPLGKVRHNSLNGEYTADQARVTAYVGSVRGIVNTAKKRYEEKEGWPVFGSDVKKMTESKEYAFYRDLNEKEMEEWLNEQKQN